MKNEIIPIFYACDDNFIKYTAVSLSSIIKNADKERLYHVHILHTEISEDMMGVIKALENESFKIFFDNVSPYLESIKDKLPTRHYYTKTTYYRFFIAPMFPEYEKAIYIDSDTVVLGDISRLWDSDVGENLVGAAHEQVMVQDKVYGEYCESVVGVSRHAFFNAGVLLINCRRFLEFSVLNKFMRLLGEYNFIVTQDEDYLNLICKDRVFWLDQRWNTELAEELVHPYPDSEAFILHYIMTSKPWHYRNSRCAEIFWEYAKKLESVYPLLKAELDSYTDCDRERDRLSGETLRQMALGEIAREDNYQGRLNAKRDSERVRVAKKIREYEREGKFDLDVENDPPSRVLLPGEIDYLRTSLGARLRTARATRMARRFLKFIIKKKLMVIKEIHGIENLRSVSGGAVICANHFNPFDTFALHVAFTEAFGKKKRLYRVIREGNYTSFPGFYGYLMRNFYTLPLSSDRRTLAKFTSAADTLISDGNFVLVYPEQSMWYNYRKPKPLKPGAYRFAVKNNVPVVPIFTTMRDSETLGEDGYPIQEYTIHIAPPIYPDESLSYKDCISDLMDKNFAVWREIYETEYGMPLDYSSL